MSLLDTDIQRLISEYNKLKRDTGSAWGEILALCSTIRELWDMDNTTPDFQIGKYVFAKTEDRLEEDTFTTYYILDENENVLTQVKYINGKYLSGIVSNNKTDTEAVKEALSALKHTVKNDIKAAISKKSRELSALRNLIT